MIRATLSCLLLFFVSVANGQESSLGDVARNSRKQKESAAAKHVLTNDDLGAPVDPLVSSLRQAAASLQESARLLKEYYPYLEAKVNPEQSSLADQSANRLAGLSRAALAKNILDAKKLDVPFIGRPDWEFRLDEKRKSLVGSLRETAKALRQYEELERYSRTVVENQGQLMKLEEFKKVAAAAVSAANQENSKCLTLAEEGWLRASVSPDLPLCYREILAPCKK